MNIKEKIEKSRSKNTFTLFREGLFYKCYNEDAMVFAQRIKAYKIIKKYIKSTGYEVLCLGFPVSETGKDSLSFKRISTILGAENISENNSQVVFALKDNIKEHFEQFRASLDEEKRYQTLEKSSCNISSGILDLIFMIKNYDLANSTPMQGLNFIQQLKTEVQKIENTNGNL